MKQPSLWAGTLMAGALISIVATLYALWHVNARPPESAEPFSLPTYGELYGPPDSRISRQVRGEFVRCEVWDRRRTMASHAAHVECDGPDWFTDRSLPR